MKVFQASVRVIASARSRASTDSTGSFLERKFPISRIIAKLLSDSIVARSVYPFYGRWHTRRFVPAKLIDSQMKLNESLK
jgi:hypothetical protein